MITYKVASYYTAEADFPLTDERCERSLNEFGIWSWTGDLSDSVGISETYTNRRGQLFRESVGIREKPAFLANSVYRETASIHDSAKYTEQKNIIERITSADRMTAAYAAVYRESVSGSDFRRISALLNISDGYSCSDRMAGKSVWKRNYAEWASVLETPVKHIIPLFIESCRTSDYGNRMFQKNAREPVYAIENMERRTIWKRDFSEDMAVTEKEYSVYAGSYRETVSAVSEFIHGPNGVLYDVSFSEGPMSIEDFKSASSVPSGYSPFVDFRVGDYEYKNAIYRFILQKKDLGVNPLLYDLVVHVDIPDTNDRGTADIPAEVTKVYFNKFYYNPPEVVASVVGGMESTGISIPYILSTDKSDNSGRYFEVVLKDGNGNPVSGKISWTARGY